MKSSLFYPILKQYVRIGLLIYFKKWQSKGLQHIPEKGPVLFVANHQNAFLEALLVVCGLKRSMWFLARGDVFRRKWAVRLLTFLQIKPVYRFRDGHSGMRQNERVIHECVELLKQGECVLIFGEGDHNEPWTFRGLQRGFAQITVNYIQQTHQDLTLIPVGFHFERHHDFRSRVLVNYGEPILAKRITDSVAEERNKLHALQNYTREKLIALILVIPADEMYAQKKDFLLHNRLRKKSMIDQLEADRKMIAEWKKEDNLKPQSYIFYKWFNPLFLYGRIVHLPVHLIMEYVVKNKITDNQFIGSVKVAVGIFLIPLYYIIITSAVYLLSHEWSWALLILISLPLSGVAAYNKD